MCVTYGVHHSHDMDCMQQVLAMTFLTLSQGSGGMSTSGALSV